MEKQVKKYFPKRLYSDDKVVEYLLLLKGNHKFYKKQFPDKSYVDYVDLAVERGEEYMERHGYNPDVCSCTKIELEILIEYKGEILKFLAE